MGVVLVTREEQQSHDLLSTVWNACRGRRIFLRQLRTGSTVSAVSILRIVVDAVPTRPICQGQHNDTNVEV